MKKFGAQNMVSNLKKVMIKKPQNSMSKVDPKKWNYESSLNQKIINDNYNEFFEILKNSGTEIIELKLENENEELCDSVFTHDPSIVIDNGAVILNMGKKLRKKETREHYNFYKKVNIPIVGQIKNEGTVEGGDCLWLNQTKLLVGESFRTNHEGIKQLSVIMNYHGIEVVSTKISNNINNNSCFHLMSIISMLDYNLAIACKSLLTENLFKILNQNNIKILEIYEDEYRKSKTLAVNILALSPRNLVTMRGNNKTLDLLDKENCKINLFTGDELCIKAEGGPTCLTRPLLRE